MLFELKLIANTITGLMSHTEETWDRLAEGKCEESKSEYMMAHYYWPLFGVSALLVMLFIGCGGLFGDGVASFNLEVGMKAAVEFVVIYGVGPMLINLVLDPIFRYSTAMPLKRDESIVFTHYTMSTLMVLEVCCSVFPNLEFLNVSKLYMIYIIAVGVDHFFKVEGREQMAVVTVLFSALFFAAPQIISFLLNFIDRL